MLVLPLVLGLACADEPDESGTRPTSARPNVLLIVADTLRADHLGVYGYARDTSPAIDALARDSLVFTAATAQAPSTLPSVLQLMTGRHLTGRAIDGDETPLAERFAAAGFATVAVVDNPILELEPTRLERGFEDFYRNDVLDPTLALQHWKTSMPADVVTRQALRWLDRRDPSRPFFAWIHYFDPHDPYFPPFTGDLPFAAENDASHWTGDIRSTHLNRKKRGDHSFTETDRRHLIDLYDAEIAYLDRSIADLVDHLRRTGLYDDTLIVFTADHGEAFGEHGHWMHGRSLHQPEIHVPLLLKLPQPDTRHEVVSTPAGLVDIAPTLCAHAALDCPDTADGRNLLGEPGAYAYSTWRDWTSVRGTRWKWMRRGAEGEERLFDLEADPGETTDRSDAEPEVLARMREAHRHWVDSLGASPGDIERESRELYERMRALGYTE